MVTLRRETLPNPYVGCKNRSRAPLVDLTLLHFRAEKARKGVENARSTKLIVSLRADASRLRLLSSSLPPQPPPPPLLYPPSPLLPLPLPPAIPVAVFPRRARAVVLTPNLLRQQLGRTACRVKEGGGREEGKALTLREASPSRPPSGVQQDVSMVPSCCQSSSASVRDVC